MKSAATSQLLTIAEELARCSPCSATAFPRSLEVCDRVMPEKQLKQLDMATGKTGGNRRCDQGKGNFTAVSCRRKKRSSVRSGVTKGSV